MKINSIQELFPVSCFVCIFSAVFIFAGGFLSAQTITPSTTTQVKNPQQQTPASPAQKKPATAKGTEPAANPPSEKKGAEAAAAQKEADQAKKQAAADEKKAKLEKFEKEADQKKADWIEKTMDFGIQKDRHDAINFIPTVQDPVRKQALGTKLVALIIREQDASVLAKALATAAVLNLQESVDAVKSKLTDQSEDVRIAAVYALKDLKAERTKPDIIEQLKKQDFTKPSNFTEAMIQTLADFHGTEIKDFSTEKIKDNKTAMSLRLALILFLGRSGTIESKDFLLAEFKDTDEDIEIRSYAVNALARLEVREAIPEINKVLDDISTYTFAKKKQYATLQLYCVSALVKLGDESAYPRLIDSLKSDNASTRIRAIKLIKDLKDKRAIDILKYKMDYDPSIQVQKAAKDALKSMDVDVGPDPDEKKAAAQTKNPAAKPDPKVKKSDPAPEELPEEAKKRDDF
jgi:HEAT repeat protein